MSALDFDLCYNLGGNRLHIVPYDNGGRSLCGRGGATYTGFDAAVHDKSLAAKRRFPLCKQCVAKNTLYDLRTVEEMRP